MVRIYSLAFAVRARAQDMDSASLLQNQRLQEMTRAGLKQASRDEPPVYQVFEGALRCVEEDGWLSMTSDECKSPEVTAQLGMRFKRTVTWKKVEPSKHTWPSGCFANLKNSKGTLYFNKHTHDPSMAATSKYGGVVCKSVRSQEYVRIPFNTSTNYMASDLKYTWNLQVKTNYSCIWGAEMPGVNQYASVLTLPPCTWIAPHYHPGTTEINMVMNGKLNGTLFPNAGEPISAQNDLGDLQVIPRQIIHLLDNDQCEDLAITHFFPSILDANFYPLWGPFQETPDSYRNAILPDGTRVLNSPDSLNLAAKSFGYNTPNQECLKRCGLPADYYDHYVCPEKMPLKEEAFDPIASLPKADRRPEPTGALQTRFDEVPENDPWTDYKTEDFNFATELLKTNNFECLYGNPVSGEGMLHAMRIMAPCTAMAPRWHPTTNEINVVMQGKLNYTVHFVRPAEIGRPPIQDQIGQAEQMVVPEGLSFSLYNDQCVDLAMMHVLPTATDEDLTSIWGMLQKAPESYKRDAFVDGQWPDLNIVDDEYTVLPECMERCGFAADYHQDFICPARIPIKAEGTFNRIYEEETR